ncbi:MAG: hypothetical protein ABFE07_11865 [Armatimonadia bacterium]
MTAPNTGVVPCFKVKVDVVIDVEAIASLNVAEISLLPATFLAPLAGTVEPTVGTVVSRLELVLKDHMKSHGSVLPDTSLTVALIVTQNFVSTGRGLEGVKLAVWLEYVTAPRTGIVPLLKVNVFAVTLEPSMPLLKAAVIEAFMGTPTTPLAGLIELTVNGKRLASWVDISVPTGPSGLVAISGEVKAPDSAPPPSPLPPHPANKAPMTNANNNT